MFNRILIEEILGGFIKIIYIFGLCLGLLINNLWEWSFIISSFIG